MGNLYIVGTPIGNLDDISKRALDILNSVDYIACEDTRVSIKLLSHFNINKKLVSYHKFNEEVRSKEIINDLKNGFNIAQISDAGCPCISDPGNILVNEAIKNNIEVYAIPGPNAIITSLMSSGLDTSNFTFYGFFNREKKAMLELIDKIKHDSSKLSIFYESPKRIMNTLELLFKELGDINIVLANDLTKKFEKKYYGKISKVISDLKENPNYELGEYVLIVEYEQEAIVNEEYSVEALLINEMVKNDIDLKSAIKVVSEKYHLSKNDVYNHSLNLKRIK